jgi:hypothetical protein
LDEAEELLDIERIPAGPLDDPLNGLWRRFFLPTVELVCPLGGQLGCVARWQLAEGNLAVIRERCERLDALAVSAGRARRDEEQDGLIHEAASEELEQRL